MTEINAIFSKISDFVTKDFLAGSLIPALAFVVGVLVAIGSWLGWTSSLLWADQLGGTTLTIYGSFIFIGIVGMAYLLNATRELMIAFWSGEGIFWFPLWWAIGIWKWIVSSRADDELSDWYLNLKAVAEDGGNAWAIRRTIRVSELTIGEIVLRLRSIAEMLPEPTDQAARKTIDAFISHLKEATANPENRVTDRQVSTIARRWLKSFRASVTNPGAKKAITALRRDLGRSLEESVEQLDMQTKEEKAVVKLAKVWTTLVTKNKKKNEEARQESEKEIEREEAEVVARYYPPLPTTPWEDVKGTFLGLKNATNLRSLNRSLSRARGAIEQLCEGTPKDDATKEDLWNAYRQFVAAAGIKEQIRQGHGEDQFQRRFEIWCKVQRPRANALGNLLASYSLYPRMAYSFDGDFNWLKVGSELKGDNSSDPLLQRIEDSRLSLYFCVTGATLALMTTLGLVGLRYTSISDVEIGGAPIILTLFLLFLLYQAAVISAKAMSGSLRTAYDRYSGNAESRRALEPAEQGIVAQAFFSDLDDQRDFLWRRLLYRMDPKDGSAKRVALAAVGRKILMPTSQRRVPAIANFASLVAFLVAGLAILLSVNDLRADAKASPRWRLTAATPVSQCTTLTKESAEAIFVLRPTTGDEHDGAREANSRLCYAVNGGIACTGSGEIESAAAKCVANLLGARTAEHKDLPPELSGSYVEVRTPRSIAGDRIVKREGLAGYMVIGTIAAGEEITSDKLAMLTLVEGGSAKVTGDPVPPIPSRIDLVASGSVAVTPTAPAQPIQFGSLDVQHTGEIDFGAMALEHGGEVDFGSIDVNHGGGGGPVAYQPNGKPAGAFFFDTCSLRPISKSELEKRLEQPLHMSNLPSGDEDIADSNENCIKRFSKELADYHFNCSNPDISPNDCIGADDWLETSADDIKNFIAPLDINSLGRLKEGLVGDNRIEVFGYADQETPDTGKPLNENLSILRARAIAAALTAMGIEPTRIRTFGYGDRMPLVPATEKNGRYLINRRADVFLLNLDSIP